MSLSEKALDLLRIGILEVCGTGRTMDEIISRVAPTYDNKTIRETVYALTGAGLLVSTGKTQGTVYRTTKLGRDTIPAYRNRKYPGE